MIGPGRIPRCDPLSRFRLKQCGPDVKVTPGLGSGEVPTEYWGSCMVLSQLVSDPIKKDSLAALEGERAQHMANFLSQALGDGPGRATDSSRRGVLRVLSRLTKSIETLPTRLQLADNLQCSLSDPDRLDPSGFCRVYEGGLGGAQPGKVRVKVAAISLANTQEWNSNLLRKLIKHVIFSAHVSHPNILPIYGFFHHPSYKICVVSPWMDHNLKEHLLNQSYHTKVSPEDRLLFMLDIISGLEYLHNSQIVHRDIRAENIFVSREGRALLTNFGASRIQDFNNLRRSTGSAFWMAPELYNGEKPSAQSDIWAFACTCYKVRRTFVILENLDTCIKQALKIVVRSPPFRLDYKTLFQMESFFLEGGKVIPPKPGVIIDTWSKGQQKVWDQVLMAKCWQRHPNKRPETRAVRRSFQKLNIPDKRRGPSKFLKPPRIDSQIDYELVHQTLLEVMFLS
ncbi:hypothetical protein D9756_002957 [Leucocoprinus leucothites]|uniref:Protein kinase domain-containing protein n=1 Tax=Leucocoprinus leucothites TaxID=201217 RepID=A0A8H5LJU7_9AGAR|nr:hypothetical protein D9756_002957 [Leucoagaricus leucothites]